MCIFPFCARVIRVWWLSCELNVAYCSKGKQQSNAAWSDLDAGRSGDRCKRNKFLIRPIIYLATGDKRTDCGARSKWSGRHLDLFQSSVPQLTLLETSKP